jgi:hypothetical protein
MRTPIRPLVLLVTGALGATACDDPLADEIWASRLELSTTALELRENESADLRATLFDQAGRPVVSPTRKYVFRWSVADSSIASLDGSGEVVRVSSEAVGETTITVTAEEVWTEDSGKTNNGKGNGGSGGGNNVLRGNATVKSKQQPTELRITGGNGQTGKVTTTLPEPLQALFLDKRGAPVPDLPVEFRIVAGGGELSDARATTDSTGTASTTWTLGTTAGPHHVEVVTEQLAGEFDAEATPGDPAATTIVSGGNQTARPGQALPAPVVVQVSDALGNGIAGVAVAWSVTSGGGSISGGSTSDANGRASATWTLGDVLGEQRAVASAAGFNAPITATASLTSPTQPASVRITSHIGTFTSIGQTARFLAEARDAAGNVLDGVTFTWTTTNPSVLEAGADGTMTARAVGQVLAIVAAAGLADTVAVSVTNGPTEVAPHTVALEIVRWSGSGTALVSTAIPLAPGMLMPGQTGNLRIVVGSEDKSLHVEGLTGRHRDGSLRSVLVQFTHSVGSSPIPATMHIGAARTTANRAKVAPALTLANPLPDAVIVPTDPDYLISTQIVGPTVRISQADSYEPRFRQLFRNGDNGNNGGDARFALHLSDYQTVHIDHIVQRNYYDRSLASFAHWVQTGDPRFFRWGVYYAIAYKERYFAPNGCVVQPFHAQIEGVALLYTLLGDEASRACVGTWARDFYAAWFPQVIDTEYVWADGRHWARLLEASHAAWRVGDASRDWPSLMRQTVNGYLPLQQADGAWRFRSSGWYSLNFMSGLLNDALIRYYEDFEADARIVPAIAKAADFLATQWLSEHGAFKYAEGHHVYDGGEAISDGPAPDLNLLIVNTFGFAYQRTGQAKYRTMGDLAFREGLQRAYIGMNASTHDKQYNQQFRSGFRYFAYRR